MINLEAAKSQIFEAVLKISEKITSSTVDFDDQISVWIAGSLRMKIAFASAEHPKGEGIAITILKMDGDGKQTTVKIPPIQIPIMAHAMEALMPRIMGLINTPSAPESRHDSIGVIHNPDGTVSVWIGSMTLSLAEFEALNLLLDTFETR